MKYQHSEILKELKHIKKCHYDFGKSGQNSIDNTADCIYNENNVGILNYLVENKYIIMQNTSVGRTIPFLSPYGNDFLKKGSITCLLKDYEWSIKVFLGILITLTTSFLIWHFTINILPFNP